MSVPVLPVEAFYTAVDLYMDAVDPGWREEQFREQVVKERARLGELLGPGAGRTALDCTCGAGGQAIPLAQLGWRVTGTDATPAAIETARRRALDLGLSVDWRVADLRAVGGLFPGRFDVVLSCMALDNLVEDAAILDGPRSINAAFRARIGSTRPSRCVHLRLPPRRHPQGRPPLGDDHVRRALRAAELAELMRQAGFDEITFLEQASPWSPHEILAVKA